MLDSIFKTIAGPVIQGLFGMEGAEQQASEARAQADTNYLRQLEFAKHGIRWKVEDAVAAGLHPLYALSGGGAAFAPNPITVSDNPYAAMGQSLSRAIAAQETETERAVKAATLKKLEAEAEKEFAMASYYRSEAMRRAAPAAAPMPESSGSALLAPGSGGDQPSAWNLKWPGDVRSTDGIVSLKPAPVTARDPKDRSMEAGVNPAHSKFNPEGKGLHEIVAPSKELKERFEDLPIAMQLYYGLRNLPVLGEMLTQQFMDWRESRTGDAWTGSRNRASGKIRRAEPRVPSDVPGYRGSW